MRSFSTFAAKNAIEAGYAIASCTSGELTRTDLAAERGDFSRDTICETRGAMRIAAKKLRGGKDHPAALLGNRF
jgi:hypothetical protein